MRYKWNSRSKGKIVHLCDATGMTLCKAENGPGVLDYQSDWEPLGTRRCEVCAKLDGSYRPTARVINGQHVVALVYPDESVVTIGRDCPWFDEAVAEHKRALGL